MCVVNTCGHTIAINGQTMPSTCPCSAQSVGGRGQDFSALQQHIDELTTSKFELERGLAQQGKLAASLAAENMRLSEDFNQQV